PLFWLNVALFAPAHDEFVRALVVACLVSASRLAPRRDRMTPAGSLAFTAAVRMVNWIHRNAAVVGTLAHPACSPRFSNPDVLMIDVADLTDRRHAILRNLAGFAGGQLHQCVLALFRYQLSLSAGGAYHLCAFARLQLQIVNRRARRNVFQLERIAHQDVGIWTTGD